MFAQIAWRLLFAIVSLPLIKGFYDVFTAPGTGLLVQAGANDATLAIITVIPWAFPVGCIISAVVKLSHRNDNNRGFPLQ